MDTTAPGRTQSRPQDHPVAFAVDLVAWAAVIPGALAFGFSVLVAGIGALFLAGQPQPEGAFWLIFMAALGLVFSVGMAAPHLVTLLVLRRFHRLGRVGAGAPLLVLVGVSVTVLVGVLHVVWQPDWHRPFSVLLWVSAGIACVEAVLLSVLAVQGRAQRA